jgi:hypothetical protein
MGEMESLVGFDSIIEKRTKLEAPAKRSRPLCTLEGLHKAKPGTVTGGLLSRTPALQGS